MWTKSPKARSQPKRITILASTPEDNILLFIIRASCSSFIFRMILRKNYHYSYHPLDITPFMYAVISHQHVKILNSINGCRRSLISSWLQRWKCFLTARLWENAGHYRHVQPLLESTNLRAARILHSASVVLHYTQSEVFTHVFQNSVPKQLSLLSYILWIFEQFLWTDPD